MVDGDVWSDDEIVDYVTSGGYGHYVQQSIALGFVASELRKDGEEFEVEILGDRRRATVTTQPLLDPEAKRMRG